MHGHTHAHTATYPLHSIVPERKFSFDLEFILCVCVYVGCVRDGVCVCVCVCVLEKRGWGCKQEGCTGH